MISLQNVSKKFNDRVIFDNINFSISKCGLYLIDGESGVGKSTLLNIIVKLTSYKGKVVNEHLHSFSYVSQNNFLINHLSVEENLKFFNIESRKLNKFNLHNKLKDNVNELSMGEKSRLSLMIGLYGNCELLLVDEPITNLDKRNAKIIVKEIYKVSKSKIILIISHEKELFINKIDGILKIKNKKIECIDNSNNYILKTENKKIYNLNRSYFINEYKYYKKDNIKIYLFIFFLFLSFFAFLYLENLFLNSINKDIENSVDYNKFYLGECSVSEVGSIKIENCKNPSSFTIDKARRDGIKVGFNYDYLLSFLYKREDLSFISNNNIKLMQGRYPRNEFEVIASEKYSINEKISLESNIPIGNEKNDVYYKKISITVVGIYSNLNFLNDNNIYFDYDLIDDYYRKEILINNNVSLHDYFLDLDIDEYRYVGFSLNKLNYLSMKGTKYDFYSNLLMIYKEISLLIKWFEIACFVCLLFMIFRFNKSRLKLKQRTNVLLISNSFGEIKSCLLSLCLDFLYVSGLCLLFSSLLLLINVNMSIMIIVYLSVMSILFIQTYFYYRKKNIANLLREEIW